MSDASDNYNKIYSENKNVFGSEPAPIVRQILNFSKSGKVIEFGAGEGRNSLFLAAQGFDVTAVDISTVAIEKLTRVAKENNLIVETIVSDIVQFEFPNTYDVMVSTFTLHHLLRNQALSFINNLKENTNSGGLNVITSITKNGDFYRSNPETDLFYLEENELQNLYQGWQILNYFEKESKAFAKHPDGSSMVNTFAGIISKKL